MSQINGLCDKLQRLCDFMLRNKLIDGIIPEPVGGAHVNHAEASTNLKNAILENLAKLNKIKPEKRMEQRIKKFEAMGVFEG